MASSHAAAKRPRCIGGGRGADSDARHATDGWERRYAATWSDSAARSMLMVVETMASNTNTSSLQVVAQALGSEATMARLVG